MKPRTLGIVVVLIALVVAYGADQARAVTPPAAPPKPAAPPPQVVDIVVKYGGKLVEMPGVPAHPALQNGKMATVPATPPHDAFQATPMPTGELLTFLVPNVRAKPEVYNPDPLIDAAIKPLQAGDLIQVVFYMPAKLGPPVMLTSAKVYTAKPGEDDPHGYVFVESFDHKDGAQMISEITISRYLVAKNCIIPSYPDSDGDMVADDVITGIVKGLHGGEVVYADLYGPPGQQKIKLLAPWKNHFTGKFVKLDPEATVDSNNDTGPAVELTGPDGKSITALIPGKMMGKRWTADPSIVSAARGIKPDTDVDYITADSGDKRTWLVNITRSKPPEKSASARARQP